MSLLPDDAMAAAVGDLNLCETRFRHYSVVLSDYTCVKKRIFRHKTTNDIQCDFIIYFMADGRIVAARIIMNY